VTPDPFIDGIEVGVGRRARAVDPAVATRWRPRHRAASLSRRLALGVAVAISAVCAIAAAADGALAWTPYQQLGTNQVKGLSATSPAPGQIDLYVVGTDNQLWHKHADNAFYSRNQDPNETQPAAGTWSAGYDLAGTKRIKAVAATSTWDTGLIDVLMIDMDGRLWHRRFVNGQWTAYRPLGTPDQRVKAVTAAARPFTNGDLDVFVIGTDDRIYRNRFVGGWTGYFPIPGLDTVRAISAATDGVTLHLAAVLRRDSEVHYRRLDVATDTWGNWRTTDSEESLLSKAVANVMVVDRGHRMARIKSDDDSLQYSYGSTFYPLRPNPVRAVTLASPDAHRTDALVMGTDGAVWQTAYYEPIIG
jgi:hypothetical protein